METQNKELTKKVLNALDPKYILSQDQQSKITSVFRSFRERSEKSKKNTMDLARAGIKHVTSLEKGKQLFQKGKEWMGKQAIFNPKATMKKFKNPFKRKQPGGTRKLSNTSANLMRK